jgi:3-oxoacyl-[acyl-carrier-protein] synthase II
MSDPIVITGMGVVTPIGESVETFWHSVLTGKSGLKLQTDMDLSDMPCGWVAGVIPPEIRTAVVSRWKAPGRTFAEILLMDAVDQALKDAQFTAPLERPAGLVWARTCPASGSSPQEYNNHMNNQAALYEATSGAASAVLEYLRIHGSSYKLSDLTSFPTEISKRLGAPLIPTRLEATCSGGVRSIAEAVRLLRLGKAEFAIAATGDSRRTPYIFSQYAQLTAASSWKTPPEQASMPFDRRRCGMVISEAAGALVLETAEHARRRGVDQFHAVVHDWGLAVGHAHVTAPRVDMVERVMRTALARSGMEVDDIDSISAHGTSTKLNDFTEAQAMHGVFGARMSEIDVFAIKSLTGHCSATSGILETVASSLTLCRGVVPPIVTCTEPDPECNVKTYLQPMERPIKAVMKNSFGFGGQYMSMVFSRPEAMRLAPAHA